jgi:ribosomal-protein-alanine N-acetyltransferase
MHSKVPSTPGSVVDVVPATWRDLRDLRNLEKACFGDDAWPLIDLIGVLSVPGIVRLKVNDTDQMIGFIAGERHGLQNMSWIATFGVLPSYQRQGIGSALLHACEDQLDAPRIRLTVRIGNQPALNLYKKYGYQQVDIWRKYYRGGADAIVLEKVFHNRL